MEKTTELNKNKLINQLIQLRVAIQQEISTIEGLQDQSKQNLGAFLALQKYASESIDSKLVAEGLSKAKEMTPHILHSLNKIINYLSSGQEETPGNPITANGATLLETERIQELFGKSKEDSTPIMVTLDKRMLEKPKVFKDLIKAGMTIARINLARDSLTWKQLVGQVRNAERQLGIERRCKIYMDLPGPKIRVSDYQKADTKLEKQPFIKVKKGDTLRIYKDVQHLGKPKTNGEPASLGITVPEALTSVEPGHRVFFDDGDVTAVVIVTNNSYLDVEISLTRGKEAIIRPKKGVNFPDSNVSLHVSAIRETDIQLLQEILPFVDLIGVSFVHHPEELQLLARQLEKHGKREVGVIAKIETKTAMLNLPKIIAEGLNFQKFGVMIARGDLALEVNYEQLATSQERILEICRAAHIPVIWATGVLDHLTKKGIPLRAEVTDADMGLRADCIMLNKGAHITDSVKFLKKLEKLKYETKEKGFW